MAKPFLKWAGGKAALMPQLLPLVPEDVGRRRYVEPFLGGGAMFFALSERQDAPKDALLADVNVRLIFCYEAVVRDAKGVADKAGRYLKEFCELEGLDRENHYYRQRQLFNNTVAPALLAPRFIYLNRTCFNGLYRENKKGEFNVPMGRYKLAQIDRSNLIAAGAALRKVDIVDQGFKAVCAGVASKDFVYFDPPYDTRDANFKSYSAEGFGREQQIALADEFKRLSKLSMKPPKLMLSNADTPLIRSLYMGFNITEIQAKRSINSKGGGRGVVTELVIRNYT